mmetsp:Transcript_17586/g.19914  ORF Transcript_17586/g.19914 Transcript_17586/m.19914 type:complete len:183 (-) Transcript_17586:54-602(-)
MIDSTSGSPKSPTKRQLSIGSPQSRKGNRTYSRQGTSITSKVNEVMKLLDYTRSGIIPKSMFFNVMTIYEVTINKINCGASARLSNHSRRFDVMSQEQVRALQSHIDRYLSLYNRVIKSQSQEIIQKDQIDKKLDGKEGMIPHHLRVIREIFTSFDLTELDMHDFIKYVPFFYETNSHTSGQ